MFAGFIIFTHVTFKIWNLSKRAKLAKEKSNSARLSHSKEQKSKVSQSKEQKSKVS